MSDEKEAFLTRWSRLKREQPAEVKAEPAVPAPALPPALPPVETLTPESDFAGFMHPKVTDELRRVALKKLFSDPHFNVVDPFEPYSRDWTVGEPITPEFLATLNQARTVLFTEPEKKAEQEDKPVEGEAKQDEPGRQDT